MSLRSALGSSARTGVHCHNLHRRMLGSKPSDFTHRKLQAFVKSFKNGVLRDSLMNGTLRDSLVRQRKMLVQRCGALALSLRPLAERRWILQTWWPTRQGKSTFMTSSVRRMEARSMEPMTKFLTNYTLKAGKSYWARLAVLAYISYSFKEFCEEKMVPSPFTGRMRFEAHTEEEIAQLSDVYAHQMQASNPVLTQIDYNGYIQDQPTQRVNSIVQWLIQNNPELDMYFTRDGFPGNPWKVVVMLDEESCNAICYLNGTIFVDSGLLRFATSDDELAFILGHEMAHVMLGHDREIWAISTFLTQFSMLVLGGVGKWFELNDARYESLVDNVLSNIEKIVMPLFPKETFWEWEADEFGFKFATKACYDFRKFPDILSKMETIKLNKKQQKALAEAGQHMPYPQSTGGPGQITQSTGGPGQITPSRSHTQGPVGQLPQHPPRSRAESAPAATIGRGQNTPDRGRTPNPGREGISDIPENSTSAPEDQTTGQCKERAGRKQAPEDTLDTPEDTLDTVDTTEDSLQTEGMTEDTLHAKGTLDTENITEDTLHTSDTSDTDTFPAIERLNDDQIPMYTNPKMSDDDDMGAPGDPYNMHGDMVPGWVIQKLEEKYYQGFYSDHPPVSDRIAKLYSSEFMVKVNQWRREAPCDPTNYPAQPLQPSVY